MYHNPPSALDLPRRSASRRAAFTLVEIIVVIAIIAILAALLVPAVMSFLGEGPKVVCANEISQLDQAIQSFCQTYKVKYIPSQIVICEDYADYLIPSNLPANQQNLALKIDQDSINYLLMVWPHLLDLYPNGNPPDWKVTNSAGGTLATGIDWNGDGRLEKRGKKSRVVLTGDQCLVFFLGGIQLTTSQPYGTFGFSTNPRNPSLLTAGPAVPASLIPAPSTRKGPFYDFSVSGRLNLPVNTATTAATTAPGFLNYMNPYPTAQQQPYAYFSSYGLKNGYNPYDKNGNTPSVNPAVSDCPFLVAQDINGNATTVMPYFESLTPFIRFYNSTGYQIMSAGADGIFGPGGNPPTSAASAWIPSTAANMPLSGKDDQTNFVTGLMASGGN